MTADTTTGPQRTSLVKRVPYDLRARRLQVLRIEPLSMSMRRVVLGGPELERGLPFRRLAATDHVKLLIPEAGRALVLPRVGAGGNGLDASGAVRDYTIRRVDDDEPSLSIDFVLHDHGPAGRWATQAEPGAEIGVLGPRGSQVYPGTFGQYLLVADETALPAAERFLEDLPGSKPVQLLVFGAGAGAIRPLAGRQGVVHWLDATDPRTAAEPLLAAVSSLPIGPDTFVWGAGEAGVMRALRRYVRDDVALPREQIDVRGYWRTGVAGAISHAESVS